MPSVLLPVPHVPQRQPGECLAVCAAMMLLHLGLPVSYNRLLKRLRVKTDLGAPISNVRYLEKLGVTVIYRQGTWTDLLNHLTNGQPCLIPVDTDELPYWPVDSNHAVLLIGLDDDYVYLNDPAFSNGPLQVSRGDFDLAWLERDEYYVVIALAE